jgi:hypothetical protein
MPGHGSDHSSLFPGKRSAAASPGSSVTSEPVWTGQNFRKGSGQNFRNPHCSNSPSFDETTLENVIDTLRGIAAKIIS